MLLRLVVPDFHLDRESLMATHYCGRGNQPRLLLKVENGGEGLTFHFLDATNLQNHDEAHLVRLHLSRVGDEMLRREVYVREGKETEGSLRLRRVEPMHQEGAAATIEPSK